MHIYSFTIDPGVNPSAVLYLESPVISRRGPVIAVPGYYELDGINNNNYEGRGNGCNQ